MPTFNEWLTLVVLALQLLVFSGQRKLMAQQLQQSLDADERNRRHDRLSVRPLLDFTSNAGERNLQVTLENQGMGTAVNIRLEIRVDGKLVVPIPSQLWPTPLLIALGITDSHLPGDRPQRGFLTTPTAHLRPGGQIAAIDFTFSAPLDINAVCRKLTLEAHYFSVYLDEDEPFVARVDYPMAAALPTKA